MSEMDQPTVQLQSLDSEANQDGVTNVAGTGRALARRRTQSGDQSWSLHRSVLPG